MTDSPEKMLSRPPDASRNALSSGQGTDRNNFGDQTAG
jgi:hypothetical protein